MRRGVAICLPAGLAVVAALATVPARAVGTCPSPFTTVGESTCVVPANAVSVTFTAIGGSGASTGGVGDNVQATFPVGAAQAVTPGETLYVEVGSNASGSSAGANGGGVGGSGDFGSDGGGGGGASDVRTCSASSCSLSSSDTRLVVAAGGGGGGDGGAGGNAGQPGSDALPAHGGGAGTTGGPGTGGSASCGPCSSAGGDGSRGQGGSGGAGFAACGDGDCAGSGGGGAGGGYFGGGGGAGGFGTGGPEAGAGGGGGADFVAPAATSHSSSPNSAKAPPSVTVSFALMGTITVTKHLITSTGDPARFNLRIDGTTYAANVGDGGTTGAISVGAGPHTVSETAGTSANLANYVTRIACSNGAAGYGTSLSGITVGAGQNVTCTITNTRRLFRA